MKQSNQTFLKAFANALNGMRYFFLHERNGKIQISIAIITVVAAIGFGVTVAEWSVILFCIAAVISLEMLNSALEKLCDLVQEEYHPVIKIVKDVAAGAVLWAAIISAVIGLIIFLPKIYVLL
ncbi:diacylglycerol kinase family protein [Chitinophagaceae bacterium LWZ2-11]